MKKNVFIYGGTNPSFIKEIYKNLNVCFSIHSNEGIEKNENHQNLIINNFPGSNLFMFSYIDNGAGI